MILRYASPVLPPKPGVMAIMVPALITNLIPDPQRPKEEKLVTGQMPSRYPPMISHMAKAIKEIHRHPTRTIQLMDTTKTRPRPAISPIFRYLPLMLSGIARQWINDLAENSIQTWFDMQTAFTEKFEGTYKRPHNIGDLQRCRRVDDETSQTFLA
jgi:hypothetical protein